MKEGDKVIVTGSVEVYERDGKYQIYARQIELDGAGNLYLQFEALKRAEVFASYKIGEDGAANGFTTEENIEKMYKELRFNIERE